MFAQVSDEVISIESNSYCYEFYRRKFKERRNVRIVYLPFPDDPKGRKRYPGEQKGDRKHYVAHPEWYKPDCEYVTHPRKYFKQGSLGIVFIDGAGYRRDCMRVVKPLLKENIGVIVLHDYPKPNKVVLDMPSGRTYDDVVNEFRYVKRCPEENTTLLSDSANWFMEFQTLAENEVKSNSAPGAQAPFMRCSSYISNRRMK